MKTVWVETTWRNLTLVDVPDDYVFNGNLDKEWAHQVDSEGASLVDWDVKE